MRSVLDMARGIQKKKKKNPRIKNKSNSIHFFFLKKSVLVGNPWKCASHINEIDDTNVGGDFEATRSVRRVRFMFF